MSHLHLAIISRVATSTARALYVIHDKFCQEKKRTPSALGRVRGTKNLAVPQCAVCLSARFPRYAEPSIHLLPLATAEPRLSQKIEFVFSAVPKQLEGASGASTPLPRRISAGPGRLHRLICFSFSWQRRFMPRRCCDSDSSQIPVRRDRPSK